MLYLSAFSGNRGDINAFSILAQNQECQNSSDKSLIGIYTFDFVCLVKRLIIEFDGDYNLDNQKLRYTRFD
ncbi:hypothetical protein B6V88_06060 [Legionella micdadei]|nr:hypothetical protein B6V88_06060 [Legionella micdadei]